MKEYACEKEQQVTATLYTGQCDPEILAHARTCPVCSEILLVAGFLREEKHLAEHELGALPDAGLIWRKAQAMARENALAKATRPILIVRTVAYFATAFSALWLRFAFSPTWGWPELSLKHLGSVERFWPAVLNSPVLLMGLTGTLIFVGLSSWYMLQEY